VKLLPSPNTELLRGHTLRALGRLAEAMESYQRVKREAGAKVRNGEKRYRPSLEEAGRYSAVLETKLGQVSRQRTDVSSRSRSRYPLARRAASSSRCHRCPIRLPPKR